MVDTWFPDHASGRGLSRGPRLPNYGIDRQPPSEGPELPLEVRMAVAISINKTLARKPTNASETPSTDESAADGPLAPEAAAPHDEL